MDEAVELREAIYRRINFDQKDKIRILVENDYNMYIIDEVDF